MARRAALLVLLFSFALSLSAGMLPRHAEYCDPRLLRCAAERTAKPEAVAQSRESECFSSTKLLAASM